MLKTNPVKKRKNSRAKGARGERRLAQFLRSLGFQSSRRGQQYSGSSDSPDVGCDDLKHVHIECKRTETIGLGTVEMDKAISQASTDAGLLKAPVVMWRRNGTTWLLTCSFLGFRITLHEPEDIKRMLVCLNTDVINRMHSPNAAPTQHAEFGM